MTTTSNLMKEQAAKEILARMDAEEVARQLKDSVQKHAEARLKLEQKQARDDAYLFSALSNPSRLRILRMLAESDVPLLSMDIQTHFPMEQSSIAHHMKALRDAGLVDYEQDGQYHHYSIVAGRMRYAVSLLAALVSAPEEKEREDYGR